MNLLRAFVLYLLLAALPLGGVAGASARACALHAAPPAHAHHAAMATPAAHAHHAAAPHAAPKGASTACECALACAAGCLAYAASPVKSLQAYARPESPHAVLATATRGPSGFDLLRPPKPAGL